MKSFLSISLLFLVHSLIGQETKEQAFVLSNKPEKELEDVFDKKNIIIISRKNDSIFFKNEKGRVLNSFLAINPGINSQISRYTLKDTFLLENKLFIGKLDISTENEISYFRYTINDKELLTISKGKSYHCINHGATIHKCPGPPSLANPPCGDKDCVWKSD